MSSSTPAAPAPRVPIYNILSFGTLGVPLAATLVIFGVYLPRHYVSLGIDDYKAGAKAAFLAVTAAITITRVIDIVFDPLVALVMDWTKTPIGRYRPWLVAGIPVLMLGIYKVLLPTAHPTSLYLIGWLLVTYAGMSMVTLGLAAWSAVLARTYNDRSRVFAWQQAMGVVGSVTILCMPLFTHGKIAAGVKSSMPTLGLILIVALPIALLICAGLTPEKVQAIPKRPSFTVRDYVRALGRPSMLRLILADLALTLGPGTTGPLYVYYFHDAKGFKVPDVGLLLISYIGAGILGAPFWGRVAGRFGKHRTVQIACVFYSITQTILMALPRVYAPYSFGQTIPTILGMFSVGFCASAFLLLVRSMIADVADEVKLEVKQDLTSLLFSMVTTTTKIGASITVLIVFPILALVNYNGAEGAVNTSQAIFGLEMCYLFAPIILVWFGGAMFFGYKLDSNRHAEIRQALAELDVAAAEESLIGPTTEPPEVVAAAE
ncbi:MAG TPA: MFS transporter [Caulobacteraceae bacterium]|nr:MFS transporter [Caulobacteraceae bacterium]